MYIVCDYNLQLVVATTTTTIYNILYLYRINANTMSNRAQHLPRVCTIYAPGHIWHVYDIYGPRLTLSIYASMSYSALFRANPSSSHIAAFGCAVQQSRIALDCELMCHID